MKKKKVFCSKVFCAWFSPSVFRARRLSELTLKGQTDIGSKKWSRKTLVKSSTAALESRSFRLQPEEPWPGG